MSRFTRRTRFTGLAAASLLVLAAAAAPVRAQTPPASPPAPALVDDSLVNGGLIGLGVGFGVGYVTAVFLDSTCDVRNCTPLSGTEFTAVTAAGAGIGLLTGLLIDKARRDPPPFRRRWASRCCDRASVGKPTCGTVLQRQPHATREAIRRHPQERG